MYTPPLGAGTKWIDKLTILSKVEGPMGLPVRSCGPFLHRGGDAAAFPCGRTRGYKFRVRYNLIVNFFVIFGYFVLNKYYYMSLEPMV